LAAARVKTILDTYQQPAMDPAVNEALHAYVAKKKASLPDSFT
jgi:trimethylamine--corrinoid protein Co-methyltransferase